MASATKRSVDTVVAEGGKNSYGLLFFPSVVPLHHMELEQIFYLTGPLRKEGRKGWGGPSASLGDETLKQEGCK